MLGLILGLLLGTASASTNTFTQTATATNTPTSTTTPTRTATVYGSVSYSEGRIDLPGQLDPVGHTILPASTKNPLPVIVLGGSAPAPNGSPQSIATIAVVPVIDKTPYVAFGLVTTASPSVPGTPVANQTPLSVWTAVPSGFQGGCLQNQGSVAIYISIGRGSPSATNAFQSLAAGQTYDLNAYEACQSLDVVTGSSSAALFARREPSP